MTGYSKIEQPFSRKWLTCFLDDTNFEAFEVPLDSGTRGTSVPPFEPQDLMVQIQEYHRLGQSTGPYAYNAVTPEAPIDRVQLATIYQTGPGHVRYYDFDKEIRRFACLHPTDETYLNLFLFENSTDLGRRLGTSKNVMSPFKS